MSKNVVTAGSIVGLLNVVVVILNNYVQFAGPEAVPWINLALAILNGVIVF